jgi:trimeric autotransporter adhesin
MKSTPNRFVLSILFALLCLVACGIQTISPSDLPGALAVDAAFDAGSDATPDEVLDASQDAAPEEAAPGEVTLGGAVTGLTSKGLVISNGAETALIEPGATSFAFSRKLAKGASYNVQVKWQPTFPAQECTVSNGSGLADVDVTNVVVACVPATFPISVNVVGLQGGHFTLQNNGSDDLAIAPAGPLTKATFSRRIASGDKFDVTIKEQPAYPFQVCKVGGGAGTVVAGEVTVNVNCTNKHSVGGTVTGLTSRTLQLVNAVDGDIAYPQANGSFSFVMPHDVGERYWIQIKQQPYPEQTCTIRNGEGVIAEANVTSVEVVCTDNTYPVGGMIYGLKGEISLVERGILFVLNRPGEFRLPREFKLGESTQVSIVQQPASQPADEPCVVMENVVLNRGTDYLGVGGVKIFCPQYSIVGGEVSGLRGTGLVITSDAVPLPTINANGTFSVRLGEGNRYNFAIQTQPTNPAQVCTFETAATGVVPLDDAYPVRVVCD